MAGPGLPVNVDTTYADSGTDPSVKIHQQNHDTSHGILNKIDKDATPTNGQVLTWNSGGGVYLPSTIGAGGTGSVEPSNKQSIYVDPVNGSDGNDGLTPARAYRTIQAAANAAPIGAVLFLLAGTYDLAGTPVTLDPTKPLAIEGRTMPTRQWGSAGPFITSSTPVAVFFDIPTQASYNSSGFSFKNLRFDAAAGLTSTGAAIRARNLCHTLVENVIAANNTANSATKVLIDAAPDFAHGDDCSWWRVKNCVSIGQPLMRNPLLTATNYWVFDGCIIQSYGTGTGIDIGGTRSVFTGGCDFEAGAVAVHLKNSVGGSVEVVGESITTLVLLENSTDVEVVASPPAGTGGSTIAMVGNCSGSSVTGVTYTGQLDLSGLTTARINVSSLRYGFNLPVVAIGQTMLLYHDFSTYHFGLPNIPESMADAFLGPGIAAEYWTGSAWASWAVNTNALHVSNRDTLNADVTHKRFRLSNASSVYGAIGLLYLCLECDVAPQITITTYASDLTTVQSQDIIATVDTGLLQGILAGLRRDGGKVSVEINAALTGSQIIRVSRMAMFTAENPAAASGGVALRGRDTPNSAVTGSVGDTYTCVTTGGLYVKPTGYGTNTGWTLLT